MADPRRCSAVNPAYALLAAAGKVLLLQGPVGPFFDRLADWLLRREAEVTRVVLQGGDLRDCQAVAPLVYDGALAEWPSWLRGLIERSRPDCIVLFGQSRLYHRVALRLGAELAVPVVVLEEGYFRPGYLTMELGGVNSFSTTLDRYRWTPAAARLPLAPAACSWHFQQTAWHAARHYAALWRHRSAFAFYLHHRASGPLQYAAYWLRSWALKALCAPGDAWRQHGLAADGRPYFFVPLQHDGDPQVTQHSGYARNAEFIVEVMRSFSLHAAPETLLVFKQHPQSRGATGHSALIRGLGREMGLAGRVRYLLEGDTGTLSRHAAGVVLINSTVGLQALQAGTPLMVMGEAVYKRPHLTASCSLEQFWADPPRPDPALVEAFLDQLKNLTQMPASLYARRGQALDWP